MRYFNFKWHKNEKYIEPIEREHMIMTGDCMDAKFEAIAIFHKNFGSARENTITSIQELAIAEGKFDKDTSAYNQYLEPIGEPFTPESLAAAL